MRELPYDPLPDSTLALIFEGYPFILNRRRRFNSDAFACRLMLRRAVCIGGPDAARFFYDTELFRRANVTPRRIKATLLGEGGIHGLDGPAHRHRKAMYLSFMAPDKIRPLVDIMQHQWRRAQDGWGRRSRSSVFEQVNLVLCRAVCEWAGIPLTDVQTQRRARDLTAMLDAFGGIGWRNWRGRLARRRCEAWIKAIIREARSQTSFENRSPLGIISTHRDLDGRQLPLDVAAVEFLNVIRPMMAVTYFVEFAAAILAARPGHHRRLRQEPSYIEHFVQEVRRMCPFTPFLGADACREVVWQNYRIEEGSLVVLDVYGIHHDERIWTAPDMFNPDRFKTTAITPYNLIPQGGGLHDAGHRCAGEWITIETLKIALSALAEFDIDAHDYTSRLARIPSRIDPPPMMHAPAGMPAPVNTDTEVEHAASPPHCHPGST